MKKKIFSFFFFSKKKFQKNFSKNFQKFQKKMKLSTSDACTEVGKASKSKKKFSEKLQTFSFQTHLFSDPHDL